jgi:hypothetical protein
MSKNYGQPVPVNWEWTGNSFPFDVTQLGFPWLNLQTTRLRICYLRTFYAPDSHMSWHIAKTNITKSFRQWSIHVQTKNHSGTFPQLRTSKRMSSRDTCGCKLQNLFSASS